MSTDAKQLASEVKKEYNQSELEKQIEVAHSYVSHHGWMAVMSARDCGRLLSELKELLTDKQWKYYRDVKMSFSEATRKKYVRIHDHWKLLDDLSLEKRPKSIRQALEIISEKLKSNKSQGNSTSNDSKKPVKAIIHTKAKQEIESILKNSELDDAAKLKAIENFLESKELHYSPKPAKDEEASSDSHEVQGSAEVNGGEAASSDSRKAQPPAKANGAQGASSDGVDSPVSVKADTTPIKSQRKGTARQDDTGDRKQKGFNK